MITRGQATLLGARIRAWIAVALIGSFTLAMALIILQAAYGENPLADAMAQTLYPAGAQF